MSKTTRVTRPILIFAATLIAVLGASRRTRRLEG